ncbi:MAG: precorrin-6A synthase (deacetylating) [Pseudomonadota bacterium]
MIDLYLVGIGTGNPEHLTLEAVRTLKSADLILIPNKRAETAELAELRREICEAILFGQGPKIVEFDLPERERMSADYHRAVQAWHDAIADVWIETIEAHIGATGKVAFLVWGDPALYDSTLRISGRVAATHPLRVHVIPGVTAIQALTAGHTVTLNEIGAPFLVTTGRRLRTDGWPAGADTIVVMLDGDCAFQTLDPAGIMIWWTAYAGMPQEIRISGTLAEAGPAILETRKAARDQHGWIMDTYLLRRTADIHQVGARSAQPANIRSSATTT